MGISLKGMRRLDLAGLDCKVDRSLNSSFTAKYPNVLWLTSPKESNVDVAAWNPKKFTFGNSSARDAFEKVINEVKQRVALTSTGRRRMPERKPWHRRLPVM